MGLRHNRPAAGRYGEETYSSDESTAKGDSPPEETVPQFTPPPPTKHNPKLPPAVFPSVTTAEAAKRESVQRTASNAAAIEANQHKIQKAYQRGAEGATNKSKTKGKEVRGSSPLTALEDNDDLEDGDGYFDSSDLSSIEDSDKDDDVQSKQQPTHSRKSLSIRSRANSSSTQVTKVVPRSAPLTGNSAQGPRRLRGNQNRARVVHSNAPFQPQLEWKGNWWSASDEALFQKEMDTDDDECRERAGKDVAWDDIHEAIRLEIVEGLFRRGYTSVRAIDYLGLNQEQVHKHADLTFMQRKRIEFEDAEIRIIIGQIVSKFKKIKETTTRALDEKYTTFDGVSRWVAEILDLKPPMNGIVDLSMEQILPQSGYGKIIDRRLCEIRALWNGPETIISRADIKDARAWLKKKNLDVALAGCWRNTTLLPDQCAEFTKEGEDEDEDSEETLTSPVVPSDNIDSILAPELRSESFTRKVAQSSAVGKDLRNNIPSANVGRPQTATPHPPVTASRPRAVQNFMNASASVHGDAPRSAPRSAPQNVPSNVSQKTTSNTAPHVPSDVAQKNTPGTLPSSPVYAPQPVARKTSSLNIRQTSLSTNTAAGQAQLELQRSRVSTPNANAPYDSQRQHDALREQERKMQMAKKMLAGQPVGQSVVQSMKQQVQNVSAPAPKMTSAPTPRMVSAPAPKTTSAPVAPMARVSSSLTAAVPSNKTPVLMNKGMPSNGAQARRQASNGNKRAAPADVDNEGHLSSTPDWNVPANKRQRLADSNTANVAGMEHSYRVGNPSLIRNTASNIQGVASNPTSNIQGAGGPNPLMSHTHHSAPAQSSSRPVSNPNLVDMLSNTGYSNMVGDASIMQPPPTGQGNATGPQITANNGDLIPDLFAPINTSFSDPTGLAPSGTDPDGYIDPLTNFTLGDTAAVEFNHMASTVLDPALWDISYVPQPSNSGSRRASHQSVGQVPAYHDQIEGLPWSDLSQTIDNDWFSDFGNLPTGDLASGTLTSGTLMSGGLPSGNDVFGNMGLDANFMPVQMGMPMGMQQGWLGQNGAIPTSKSSFETAQSEFNGPFSEMGLPTPGTPGTSFGSGVNAEGLVKRGHSKTNGAEKMHPYARKN